MTKSSRTQDAPSVFLEFHFPSRDEVVQGSERIDQVLNGVFENFYSLVHSDPTGTDVVYRVQQPIFDNENTEEEFFRALLFVFNSLDDLSPHFTQHEGQLG